MHALFRHLGRFRRDKSANLAVIFAIAAVPVMTFVGGEVRYDARARARADETKPKKRARR